MLQTLGVTRALPGVTSIEEGVAIYHKFPNYEKKAEKHGVVAFELGVAGREHGHLPSSTRSRSPVSSRRSSVPNSDAKAVVDPSIQYPDDVCTQILETWNMHDVTALSTQIERWKSGLCHPEDKVTTKKVIAAITSMPMEAKQCSSVASLLSDIEHKKRVGKNQMVFVLTTIECLLLRLKTVHDSTSHPRNHKQ